MDSDTGNEAAATASLTSVFNQRGYRSVWVTNLLASATNGSSRFVFVWLIGDLTDWDPAAALLGFAIGLPALFLSVYAGSLADRIAPNRLGSMLMASAAVAFAGTAIVASTDVISVPLAIVLAGITAIPLALIMPMLQAIVPQLLPPQQLLQAVALQNMGLMAGLIIGAFFAGGIIVAAGTTGAIWFLAAMCALGWWIIVRADLPPARTESPATAASMRQVAYDALTTEPLRSLLFLTVLTGLTMTANVLLLPVIARDVLEVNALKAGLLNGGMGVGMMITSVALARRGQPSRPGRAMLITLSLGLGTGLMLIGWSTNYWLTLVFTFAWGSMGGIAMALLRTLTQQNTAPERMGRVMGLATLAQFGAFPLGALILFGLVRATSASDAMIIIGALTSVGVWSRWLTPAIRSR